MKKAMNFPSRTMMRILTGKMKTKSPNRLSRRSTLMNKWLLKRRNRNKVRKNSNRNKKRKRCLLRTNLKYGMRRRTLLRRVKN
jgi:hypothetical protein